MGKKQITIFNGVHVSVGPTGVSAENIGCIAGGNLSYSIGQNILTVYPSKLSCAASPVSNDTNEV